MDIIIVGTGVSSLLLAQSLIARRCFDRLRLVGPLSPPHAHRLSYWSDVPTPFDAHVDASWDRLRVTDARASSIDVALSRLRYRSFEAGAWLRDTLAQVLASEGVEHVATHALELSSDERIARVRLADATLSADWLFASGQVNSSPASWQRFLGWEVELEEPLSDPSTATFLDFRTAPERDFRFIYQLPLGPRRLFVEHVSYRACDHAQQIAAYLRDVLHVEKYRLVDHEAGATPLFRDPPPRREGRIVQIGVAGGLAKATTGYALTRMWRDAEEIAEGLRKRGRPRLPRRLPLLYRLADHFFLELLARAPERLPGMMSALFSRASGDAVLAFLDDRAALRQKLAVALAMPGWLRWWLWGRL